MLEMPYRNYGNWPPLVSRLLLLSVMICRPASTPAQRGGFTLVEAVVAIGVLGIGVAYSVGALTKFNSVAAIERNSTGAYSVVANQIDLFQSMSPFNPQKGQ